MLTCKNCVFNTSSVNGQTKELHKICTRFPPKMYMLTTQQGVVANVSYPVIGNDYIACGEYFDGDEQPETSVQ